MICKILNYQNTFHYNKNLVALENLISFTGFSITPDWFVLLYTNASVTTDDGLSASCTLGNYLIHNYINTYKAFYIAILLFMLLRFLYSNIFCRLISLTIVHNMYHMTSLDVRVTYGEQ